MIYLINGNIRNSQQPRVNLGRALPIRQRGVALFVGLVFLVILSMIAVVVMKGTLLQMNMTNATAKHEQAFEASESVRAIPEALLADHVFNRGWPSTWGGTVPDSRFSLNTTFAHRTAWIALLDPKTTSGQGLQTSPCDSTLVFFYLAMSTCAGVTSSDNYNYEPSNWVSSIKFTTCIDGNASCGSGKQIQNNIAIIRDGVTLNVGSGAAMSQGYASVGVGTAKGGSALLLQIRSQSKVPGNGEATTIAQYKLNINH